MNPANVPYLQQQSGTANTASLAVSTATVVPGVFATALLAAMLTVSFSSPAIAQTHSAHLDERPGTIGQFDNVFSQSYDHKDDDQFETTIANLYTQLLMNQEPLGREFEQVLQANAWDLYIRS